MPPQMRYDEAILSTDRIVRASPERPRKWGAAPEPARGLLWYSARGTPSRAAKASRVLGQIGQTSTTVISRRADSSSYELCSSTIAGALSSIMRGPARLRFPSECVRIDQLRLELSAPAVRARKPAPFSLRDGQDPAPRIHPSSDGKLSCAFVTPPRTQNDPDHRTDRITRSRTFARLLQSRGPHRPNPTSVSPSLPEK